MDADREVGRVTSTAAHAIVADLDRPALSGEDRHHLAAVLRLRPGETVSVTDGMGGWRLCRFVAGEVGLEAAGDLVRAPAPAPSITVGLAVVKGDRPEWAVQKLVELGVNRVVLFHAERSVVRWSGDRAGRHLDRLRVVARQAVMQSRQVWMPSVTGVEEFQAVTALDGATLAAPGGGPPSLERPTVLVGPEGGWSPAEEACGLPAVSLGPGVLRTETAAVTAGALLVALREGLVAPA